MEIIYKGRDYPATKNGIYNATIFNGLVFQVFGFRFFLVINLLDDIKNHAGFKKWVA